MEATLIYIVKQKQVSRPLLLLKILHICYLRVIQNPTYVSSFRPILGFKFHSPIKARKVGYSYFAIKKKKNARLFVF